MNDTNESFRRSKAIPEIPANGKRICEEAGFGVMLLHLHSVADLCLRLKGSFAAAFFANMLLAAANC
jgi:hypothetical protein